MMNLNLSILRLDLQYIVLLFHYFLLFFNIVGMPLAPSNKNYLIRESGTATPGGTFDPKILFSIGIFSKPLFSFFYELSWELQIKFVSRLQCRYLRIL